ncbi:MAG: 4Fe-4S dicluster domain-containing protein [Proteobacteria bacterium]|nr:4Fe-4S dicluster domain-containing protein [Pseudomonadota bacterium]
MDDKTERKKIERAGLEISRREFLKYSGIVVIGVGFGGCGNPNSVAASKGYLLVDTKKCQGCQTCMLACSLVHEGFESLSLARIQIVQNPFNNFPDDINIAQCRQCVAPACLAACPVGALHVDKFHGNVRTVNKRKCIGCKACITACPFVPARPIWNFQEGYAQKCDLCASSVFWNERGGPGGKQACVTVCPMKAIQFTAEIPVQLGDEGYNVNLRDESWGLLGYTTE